MRTITGYNLRTTMVDKNDAIASAQMYDLLRNNGKAFYYADSDDEFEWFQSVDFTLFTLRFLNGCHSAGASIYWPIINSNRGIENQVPAAIWTDFLQRRNGWSTMARRDLISALIRTKDSLPSRTALDWLLSDAYRLRTVLPEYVLGMIGVDIYLTETDAYSNTSVPTSWKRLTPDALNRFSRLGPIIGLNDGRDPFAEFMTEVRAAWGRTLIDNPCFVYDHGSGPRIESKNGNFTRWVSEFGVNLNTPDFASRAATLARFIKTRQPVLALAHVPVDPGEAWRWKEEGGTQQVWDTDGYAKIVAARPNRLPHEFTFWPDPAKRSAMLSVLQTLAAW